MKVLLALCILLVTSCDFLNGQEPTLSASPLFLMEGNSVRACVTYQTLPATEVGVALVTRDGGEGAAKGGSDFEQLIETLVFSPTSELEQCRDINILVDSTLENLEIFEIIASIDGVAISGSPQTPAIQSTDTITVGFGQASYSFNEDEGGQMCVVIEEGAIETAQGIELSLSSTDGTAETEADSDYNAGVILVITVALDSDTPAGGECFDVPITPDTRVESDETFTISISSNPSVVLNSATSQATVTIVNDDAACIPPTLENGDFTVDGTTPSMRGDTATYTCSAGYELVGDGVLTCQLGDVWSPTAPGTCQADCGPLSDPDDGDVTTSPSTVFPSTATYSCDDGYTLMGSDMRNCQANGTWSGEAPICEIVDCNSLTNPTNGQVEFQQTTFMSTATYSCDTGFIVDGEMTRTCQANGNWSGEEPSCREPATCPELSLIENGDVSPRQGVEGDVATYTCDEGYMVDGEAERTCQANGEWSGSEPNCTEFTAATCPELSLIENGDVSPRQGVEGDVATYTCDEGFRILNTEAERTCLASGEWSGSEPTCTEFTVNPPGGQLALSSEQMIGIGVGVSLGVLVLLILVIVAVVVLIWYARKRKADKYVLNYSTVYGNQRKNELSSRPSEPAAENDYGETGATSPQETAVDDTDKP